MSTKREDVTFEGSFNERERGLIEEALDALNGIKVIRLALYYGPGIEVELQDSIFIHLDQKSIEGQELYQCALKTGSPLIRDEALTVEGAVLKVLKAKKDFLQHKLGRIDRSIKSIT